METVFWIIHEIQKAYPEIPKENIERIRQRLIITPMGDLERLLDAFYRFGCKDVIGIICNENI